MELDTALSDLESADFAELVRKPVAFRCNVDFIYCKSAIILNIFQWVCNLEIGSIGHE